MVNEWLSGIDGLITVRLRELPTLSACALIVKALVDSPRSDGLERGEFWIRSVPENLCRESGEKRPAGLDS